MARGRMINSKITRNKAVNDLSDDTSRLAYTWLITFADVEGRTNGDPALVRSLVFPRRTDVSVDRMTAYIREWAAAGLVLWYQADGDAWIAFPTFAENQRGLDRRKEQPSDIPAPTDSLPSTYRVRTDSVPGTSQQNRREDNVTEDYGAVAPESLAEQPAPLSEPEMTPPPEESRQKDTAHRRYMAVVRDVTMLNLDVETNAKRVGKAVRGLQKAEYEPDAIMRLYRKGGWWWREYWKGKNGQPPTPEELASTIEQGLEYERNGTARASPGGNGKNAYFNDPEVYEKARREWDAK